MKKSNLTRQICGILKIMIVTFVVSGILLLLLSVLLYKADLSESAVRIGIIVIYAISCLLGGVIAGKSKGKNKFLWGLLTGVCYFILLAVGSLIFKHTFTSSAVQSLLTLVICSASGMIGGMIS